METATGMMISAVAVLLIICPSAAVIDEESDEHKHGVGIASEIEKTLGEGVRGAGFGDGCRKRNHACDEDESRPGDRLMSRRDRDNSEKNHRDRSEQTGDDGWNDTADKENDHPRHDQNCRFGFRSERSSLTTDSVGRIDDEARLDRWYARSSIGQLPWRSKRVSGLRG